MRLAIEMYFYHLRISKLSIPARFGIWSLVLGSLVCCHFEGFLSIAPKFSKYICADSLDLGAGARVAQPSPAPQLRWNDLGGYPCRRGDLGRTRWNPCDVFRGRLIPDSRIWRSVCCTRACRASGSQGLRGRIRAQNLIVFH